MALIKCPECGKEISDKSEICVKCGYPIERNDNKCSNKKFTLAHKAWLVICIIICFLLCAINTTNLFKTLGIPLNTLVVKTFNIDINMMVYLTFLLGISYIGLLKNKTKKDLYILLFINAIILIYNILSVLIGIETILSVFYILCVFINSISTFFVVRKQLNNNTKNKKHYLILTLISVIGLIILTILYNYFSPTYFDDDISNFNSATITENKTPKEKLCDYMVETNNAVCTDNKCTYTFTILNNTSYYTIDFENKIFTLKYFMDGESYYEYDFGNETGYAKTVSTIGWTVVTEVDLTFDNENGLYTYDWTCSMPGGDEVAKIMAEQVNSLRETLIKNCNDLGFSIYDL